MKIFSLSWGRKRMNWKVYDTSFLHCTTLECWCEGDITYSLHENEHLCAWKSLTEQPCQIQGSPAMLVFHRWEVLDNHNKVIPQFAFIQIPWELFHIIFLIAWASSSKQLKQGIFKRSLFLVFLNKILSFLSDLHRRPDEWIKNSTEMLLKMCMQSSSYVPVLVMGNSPWASTIGPWGEFTGPKTKYIQYHSK